MPGMGLDFYEQNSAAAAVVDSPKRTGFRCEVPLFCKK